MRGKVGPEFARSIVRLRWCLQSSGAAHEPLFVGDFESQLYAAVELIERKNLRNSVRETVELALKIFVNIDKLRAQDKSSSEIATSISADFMALEKKITRATLSAAISAVMSKVPVSPLNASSERDLFVCDLIRSLVDEEYYKRMEADSKFSSHLRFANSQTAIANSLPSIVPNSIRRPYGEFWARVIHGRPSPA